MAISVSAYHGQPLNLATLKKLIESNLKFEKINFVEKTAGCILLAYKFQ